MAKRILQIVSSISIGNGITGVVMNYYRMIDKTKIQFDFLYFEDSSSSYIEEIEFLGGRVKKIDVPKIGRIFKYSSNLLDKLSEWNYEHKIVHCHELVFLSLIHHPLKKNGTQHIIAHSHSVSYSYNIFKSLRNYLIQLPMKKIAKSYLTCSSVSGFFWYGKKYIEKGKVEIVNNAFEYKKFLFNKDIREVTRKELNVYNDFVIGHVGRFSKEKNHSFIIDVFYEFIKLNYNSKLIFIGDGPLLENIKKKVKKLKLESKVIFYGQSKDVNILYQAMDYFIFPSISEGLGLAAVEAQAAGLPTIVSNEVPIDVIVTDSIERYSIKNGPKLWAERILISSKNSRKNRANDFLNSNYDIHIQVKKIEELYKKILEL